MTPQPRRVVKKYRSQLLVDWLKENHEPSRVADIGGGKGLITFLLGKLPGWELIIIDPHDPGLPPKVRDLHTRERIKLSAADVASLPRLKEPFRLELAKGVDLLVGMHAHGSNMLIIEAAAKYHKDFVIFPCCVIDEPITPQPNINWLDSLEEYAESLGHKVKRVKLNFKGQNIGLTNF